MLREIVLFIPIVVVLVTYYISPKAFDWANVWTFVPIASIAISRGAYPNAVLSVAFGLIAMNNIRKRRANSKRAEYNSKNKH